MALWSLATMATASTATRGGASAGTGGVGGDGTVAARPSAAWVHSVLRASQGSLRWFGPQALANSAWALATLRVAPEPSWLEDFLSACDAAMGRWVDGLGDAGLAAHGMHGGPGTGPGARALRAQP